jgi:hypothetical protein
MAKPILVVNYHVGNLSMKLVIENIRQIREVVEKSGANEEYYTFVLPVTDDSNVQVFYEKDLDEVSYNELKSMIEDKLDGLK